MESKHVRTGISQWPEDERPRERLLSRGPHALTDAELLAILLRVGVQGKNAVELGRELLARFGSVQGMMCAPMSAWDGIRGVKSAKLAQVQAALELARRAVLPATGERVTIKSTEQATQYFSRRLRGLPEEHFRVAYLNRQGHLLEDSLIAHGTVDAVRPPIRAIIARALQANASALIAAHNHPSSLAEPSESDRLLTQDLVAAARPLGLKVLDHVIVADETTFSFADSGLLDEIELACLAPDGGRRQSRRTRKAQ
ncbi:MAG: DNA repair protein RadC [Armatimonadota bacterium]|nr:DNA repair protein RadC [Armatimonadota bacterium]